MFFTYNSPDLCVLTLCIKFLYLAPLPRISTNSNENYRRYDFQALGNISGKFTTLHRVSEKNIHSYYWLIKLRNSCLILIIFDIKIPHII